MRCAVLLLSLASCSEAPSPRTARSTLSATPVDVRAQAREQLSRAPEGLERVQREDGTTALRVVSGFRHASFIVRNRDGSTSQRCFEDAEQAVRWLEEAR